MSLRATSGWDDHFVETKPTLKALGALDLNDVVLNALKYLGPDAQRVDVVDFRYTLPVLINESAVGKAIAACVAALLDAGSRVRVTVTVGVEEQQVMSSGRRALVTIVAECPALAASDLTRLAAGLISGLGHDEAPEICATCEGIQFVSNSVRMDSFGGGTRIDFLQPLNETYL